MEPKQNCLYAHTAHGSPSPVCHSEMSPEVWDVSTDLRLVTLAGHEFISESSPAFPGSDVLRVPAVRMNEAKQEDVMEEECDGEERGLFHTS